MAARKQMFIVAADSKPADVEVRIQSLDVPMFKLKRDTWFVVYAGTSTEAAEAFGVRTDPVSTGVVASVENVSGLANPDLWEWVKINRPVNE